MYAERVICTILEREKVVKQKSQMSPIRSAWLFLSLSAIYPFGIFIFFLNKEKNLKKLFFLLPAQILK